MTSMAQGLKKYLEREGPEAERNARVKGMNNKIQIS